MDYVIYFMCISRKCIYISIHLAKYFLWKIVSRRRVRLSIHHNQPTVPCDSYIGGRKKKTYQKEKYKKNIHWERKNVEIWRHCHEGNNKNWKMFSTKSSWLIQRYKIQDKKNQREKCNTLFAVFPTLWFDYFQCSLLVTYLISFRPYRNIVKISACYCCYIFQASIFFVPEET